MDYRHLLDHYFDRSWWLSLPEYRQLLEEVDLVLELFSDTTNDDFDVEEDWKKLQGRLHKSVDGQGHVAHNEHSTSRGDASAGLKQRRRPGRVRWGFRVAAVLLVAALTGIISFMYVQEVLVESDGEPVFREIVLDKGQRANIVLSDGTRLELNADTRIRLPDLFSPEKREIFLAEGEAFFHVAPEPDRPFIIHSRGAVVRVLGTSFTVRSYPEDESLRVVVNEGSVSLSSEDGLSSEMVLKAQQKGYFNVNDKSMFAEAINDPELYFSWMDGFLKFRDTPMSEVARQLERRYDIEVLFESPVLENLRLTAELKSRSLNNVLSVITASLGISYEGDEWKVITFLNSNDIDQ